MPDSVQVADVRCQVPVGAGRGPDIQFEGFRPHHLEELELQEAQAYLGDLTGGADYGRTIAIPGMAWSGRLGGEIVGCCGILPLVGGRAMAWALIGRIPADQWVRVHRRVLHALEAGHARGLARIETAVSRDFEAGGRWAAALGFVCETPGGMRSWFEGLDFDLWARVRPGRRS